MLLHDRFLAHARSTPERVALVSGKRRLTYGEVHDSAVRLASFMQERGIRRGDRVVVYLRNNADFVVALYATLLAGAVFVPVGPQVKSRKLEYILRDLDAAALVTESSAASQWTPALDNAPTVDLVLCTRGRGRNDGPSRGENLEDVLASQGVKLRPQPVIDQDLASIIYTSGSTGDPKGVMLTHLNMVSAAASVSAYLGLQPDDRILCALPLSFDYGLYQVLMGLGSGATVVLETSFAYPGDILKLVERERCTVFPAVPTVFAMLMATGDVEGVDVGSVRMVTTTAAALFEPQIEYLRRNFRNAAVFSMYGLTECKRVSYLPPDELARRPGSIGRGMPNQEIYLIDDDGRRLPNGSTGELVVRGSHVMRGYWRKPDATRKRLHPGENENEMVLHTGDLFRSDSEGYLYYLGRRDDIIKSSGEKVSPREIERVLLGHDAVVEAAVLGAPDELAGHVPVAYVRLKPGVACSEHELMLFCRQQLEHFMIPRGIHLLDEFPHTENGKIDKERLHRLFAVDGEGT